MRTWFSPLAESDLSEIRRFIAADSPRAAGRVIRSIRAAVREVIGRFPFAGTSCEELAPDLRCWSVGSYVVYYQVTTRVEIVRIIHGARDVTTIFRR
jgi:toxin ParE1/3/4